MPTVVSLFSGVGISDMCFVQAGYQILVASDVASKSLEVYRYNHDFADERLNPALVLGDFSEFSIHKEIVNAAKAKLGPNGALDVLTLFLPPSNKLELFLAGVKYIADQLNPKLIYIDSLKAGSYRGKSIPALLNLQNDYYQYSEEHTLSDYGVPHAAKREPYFYLNKRYFNDSHSFNTTPARVKAPVANEIFSLITAIEKSMGRPIPLHQPGVDFGDDKKAKELIEKLNQLAPGDCLFKPGMNETISRRIKMGTTARKIEGNKILPLSLSKRVAIGWEWLVHPIRPEGLTPAEVWNFATGNLIPFELSPLFGTEKRFQTAIMERIAGCTAPKYLLSIIRQVIDPALGHPQTEVGLRLFKSPEKYNHYQLENTTYYLGSHNDFLHSKTKLPRLFEDNNLKDEKRREKLYEYRCYIWQVVTDYAREVSRDNLNSLSQTIIGSINNFTKIKKISAAKKRKNVAIGNEFQVCIDLISILANSVRLNTSDSGLIETFKEIMDIKPKSLVQLALFSKQFKLLRQFAVRLASSNPEIPSVIPPTLMTYAEWKKSSYFSQDEVISGAKRPELKFIQFPPAKRKPSQPELTITNFFAKDKTVLSVSNYQSISSLPTTATATVKGSALPARSEPVLPPAKALAPRAPANIEVISLLSPEPNDESPADSSQAESLRVPAQAQPSQQIMANPIYQYEDTDLNLILTARVKQYPLVHVLAGALIDPRVQQNRVSDVLRLFLTDAAENIRDNHPHTLLIPIDIGGHWIGLRMILQNQRITGITYYNSLNYSSDPAIIASLQQELRREGLIDQNIYIKRSTMELMQPDATSCGAFLIENFYCDIARKWWQGPGKPVSKELRNLIREKHLQLLATHEPEYYASFIQREQNNQITASSISRQMITHGIGSNTVSFFTTLASERVGRNDEKLKAGPR